MPDLEMQIQEGKGNGISLLYNYNHIKCFVIFRLLSGPCDPDPQKHVNGIRTNRSKLEGYFASLIQG